MNRIFLVTRPKYDDTTHYLFNWSKAVIDLARKKGLQVLDLERSRANKKEFTSIVAKKQPFFIFFNGHGRSDCIYGQDNEVLVKIGENEEILKSKIVYALSCKSAKGLGLESIKAGTVTYLGYDEDFIFVYDLEKVSRPLEDKTAVLFLEPSNQLVNSLLKGHTAKESHKCSKYSFAKNIQKLLTSESPPYNYLIPYLLWDMRHQVCLGDENAKLSYNENS